MNETTQGVQIAGMPVHEFAAGAFSWFWVAVAVVLVFATIFMPLYVMAIYAQVRKTRRLLEKACWFLEQEHQRQRAEVERKARFER